MFLRFSPLLRAEMTILKGIPRVLPPQLLYTLARMGHGACLAALSSETSARGCGTHLAPLHAADRVAAASDACR